ncbi:MAG: CoA pyrophosphatase [Bacteroidetes bacterium]|nr:CoA pyrophosphatase [Rhodothermia bacterium]MCX7906399.1 CoA pyrophosphatase [Bacteroidota bacterium]MDW8285571.1 CoA pyrophosphatase [Bacteroidota bacterium]
MRWIARLGQLLKGPLPGPEAQREAFPDAPDRVARCEPGARPAAVLVLFYPRPRRWCFLLEKRPENLPVHRGQIGLPGGAQKPCDPSPEATALREAAEELGLDPLAVEVLGRLSPVYIPASGFVVTPVVGWQPHPPLLRPNRREVARVLEVSTRALLDPGRFRLETWTLHGRPQRVGCFRFGGETVWGATAMILCELRALLRQRSSRSAFCNFR